MDLLLTLLRICICICLGIVGSFLPVLPGPITRLVWFINITLNQRPFLKIGLF